MDKKVDSLIKILDSLAIYKWGISSVPKSNKFYHDYSYAVSLILNYDYDLEGYNPRDFHDFLIFNIRD